MEWDGRSGDGLLELASHKRFSLVAQAFALPAGAVVLTGGESPGARSSGTAAKSGAEGDSARKRRIRETALRERRVDPQYLTGMQMRWAFPLARRA